MSKNSKGVNPAALVLLALGLTTAPILCLAADDRSSTAQGDAAADSGLYIKVRLSNPIKLSKLKSGDILQGSLSGDVYSADRKLFPSGSAVRLTVDHMGKRKRTPNDHWPWVVNAFTPRHENYPVFKNATVVQEQGESPVQVTLISSSRMREVHAKAKKGGPTPLSGSASSSDTTNGGVEVSKSTGKKPATPTLVLEAFGIDHSQGALDGANKAASPETDSTVIAALPAGTRCKILLLGTLSASKSKPGDLVRARLLEPVLLNSKLALPAGSLFEGKVVKKIPPRWLSRAGSLYLTFTDLTLPGGNRFPIAASLAGIELDESSHTRMDSEGRLHGERPGKVWMAINLGMTAGISKEVDDGMQLVIEALVSTATDASTAGTARIAASCVSAAYMATRHGRDVMLPRFTEMNISLDRPLTLNPGAKIGASAAPAGGK
jgi:hypothetical protein